MGNPIEIKTTRASEGVSRHYIIQLAYYMVLLSKDKGRLVIQRVGFRRGNTPFEAYDYEFEPGEMERYRQEMCDKRDALRQALDERDPSRVPAVRSDSERNWLCKTCPWSKECWDVDEAVHLRIESKREAS